MTHKNLQYEKFVCLYSANEPQIRAYLRSLLPSWEDVNEVIQNVALVLWRKFDQFDPETKFMKWVCVVARFEVLAYRRSKARSRLHYTDKVFELMADEAAQELEARAQEMGALQQCLTTLPGGQNELLTLAYTDGIKTKDLAQDLGVSPGSLYEKLNRIRKGLMRCIRQRLQEESA